MARNPSTAKLKEGIPYFVRTEDIETERIRSNNKNVAAQTLGPDEEKEVIKSDESMIVAGPYNVKGDAVLEVEEGGVFEVPGTGAGGSDQDLFPKVGNLVWVDNKTDLPQSVGGTRTLADNTAYMFTDFVFDSAELELGEVSPLLGIHGGISGYIHTGGGTCIKGTGVPFFMNNFYAHAPGGTMFDLTGTNDEMLVESSAFFDPVGFGNISDMGTIDGFRVPTFKGCNIEDFDSGFTITGQANKTIWDGCPIRAITSDNVSIFHFDSGFSADIVDFRNLYVKNVESNTKVVDVDSAANIRTVLAYIGNSHDASVERTNIFAGDISISDPRVIATGSYPLKDTSVIGEISLDSAEVQSFSELNDYQEIRGNTILSNTAERITKESDAKIKHNNIRNSKVDITISISVSNVPDGKDYGIGVKKNGVIQSQSERQFTGLGDRRFAVPTNTILTLKPNDTASVVLKAIDEAESFTLNRFTFDISGG